MALNFGKKYGHLGHDVGCMCQSPLMSAFTTRLNEGFSRRDFLRGAVASLAAAALGGGVGASFANEPSRPRLLKNVRIFDGVSPRYLEGRSLLIKGNRIEAILEAADVVADADVIDCGGRVLMPGMIDAHWHSLLAAISQTAAMTAEIPYVHLVAAQEAERTILRGFTTVRDVGGPAFPLKKVIDENRTAGPRIYPSGAMISQTSGHGDFRLRSSLPRSPQTNLSEAEVAGISAIADGVPEVLRRAREQLMFGACQLKIMAGGGVTSLYDPLDSLQYSEQEIKAVVGAAADWGTYVCAHVYSSAGIRRVLECGVKSIEHGQLADEETVKRIVDADAWWSLQPFLADEDSNPAGTPLQQAQRREIAIGTARAFELGKKYNAKMAFGTDVLFNPAGTATQGKQLAKISRWLTNDEVLSLATSKNGELLAMSGARNPYDGKLGVIKKGALADLLVIDGDPLDDIFVIADPDKNMKLIMKDGRLYKNELA